MIKTNFVAYDRYRADCTRWAFVRKSDPDWSSTASSLKMHNNEEELYMEFGEPYRIEHGLPEDLPSRDGLVVEVQLYVYLSKDKVWINSKEWKVYPFYTRDLVLGISQTRAPSGSITYANRPLTQYTADGVNGTKFIFRDTSHVNDRIGDSANDTTPAVADLYSEGYQYPSMVEDAVRNGALWLKIDDPGNSTEFETVIANMSGGYTAYVEILYGYIPIKRWDKTNPSAGYISPYMAQKLWWGWTWIGAWWERNVIGGAPPQNRSSVIRLKKNGDSEPTIYDIDGASNTLEIPEDVLSSGGFEWNATTTYATGQVAPTTPEPDMIVTTIDSLSSAAAITPKNTYVNVGKAVFFDWTHTIATGTQQSKYELQGLIGGVWTTLQEEASGETSAMVPVDLLSSGITAWRVRTANNDGVYGAYSEPAQVIFIVAPKVTGVTVSGNVRPTIAWQSADQQGYEIMIDGVTTGVQYGTEKSLVWNDLLADGAHVVQVRVVNRFGLFSQWAEATHEVVNVPQEVAPVLTAAMVGNADVQLMWAGEGAAETLVYRDGELIGRAQSAGVYVDHTAYDEHVYRVRVVAADSNYTDSNEVRIAVPLRETMLAAVGEWNWIELAYSATAEPPVRTAEMAPLYALNYYSGREKPVVEMSRHKSATYSVTYAVTEQQAAQLRGMMGKIVVHKRKGELIRGLLQSVSEARTWWGVDTTLQIVEVDEG